MTYAPAHSDCAFSHIEVWMRMVAHLIGKHHFFAVSRHLLRSISSATVQLSLTLRVIFSDLSTARLGTEPSEQGCEACSQKMLTLRTNPAVRYGGAPIKFVCRSRTRQLFRQNDFSTCALSKIFDPPSELFRDTFGCFFATILTPNEICFPDAMNS
jgi:hypothetical protein